MSKKHWIIFDADNTLWDLESLYDSARTEFCNHTLELLNQADRGAGITLETLDRAQRNRDLELAKTHGYSSSRFARSFEDTLVSFFPDASADSVRHVRGIAEAVFDRRAAPVDDLEEVLEKLHPKYSLGIITAGERWVQEKRIQEFHLKQYFDAIVVVERKTADVFKTFCKEREIAAADCWVVGDSIRSDVIPAKEAGLNPIHVKAPNWAAEHADLPRDVPSVDRLKDILTVLP